MPIKCAAFFILSILWWSSAAEARCRDNLCWDGNNVAWTCDRKFCYRDGYRRHRDYFDDWVMNDNDAAGGNKNGAQFKGDQLRMPQAGETPKDPFAIPPKGAQQKDPMAIHK